MDSRRLSSPPSRLRPTLLLLSLAALATLARAQVVRDDMAHPVTTAVAAMPVEAAAPAAAAAAAGQALLRKGRLRRDREVGGRLGGYDEELADIMVDFAGAF
jgi:hypothetical protein